MTTRNEVVSYLDNLLDTASVPDYPNALNGLQLENSGTISHVAAAVDFSSRAVQMAVDEKADFLLVHHGMFWPGLKPITHAGYSRLQMLIEHDVAVYSSHLPLDRHRIFGNNTLLCRELGLVPSGEFASFKDTMIGLSGESNLPTAKLFQQLHRFSVSCGGDAITTEFSKNRLTCRWAVCTGAGASSETLREAADLGIDTLIVGEGPHHTAVEANDLGIVVIYAGHYATETLGVNALAEHIAEKFSLGKTLIYAPTGL